MDSSNKGNFKGSNEKDTSNGIMDEYKIDCLNLDIYSAYGINHFQEKFGLRLRQEEGTGKRNMGKTFFSVLNRKTDSEKVFIGVPQTNVNSNNFLEFLMDSSISKSIDTYEDRVEIDFDIFKLTGLVFSGKYDNLLLEEQVVDFLSEIPVVDCWERGLFDSVMNIIRERGQDNTPESEGFKKFCPWPNNAKFAVCLTHDVDEVRKTYQYFTQTIKGLKNLDLKKAAYQSASLLTDRLTRNNPYWTFDKIMEIENTLGVRSTFYFLKERAKVNILDKSTWHHYARKYDFSDPEVVSIIRKMNSEGWEVGLHGSFESYRVGELLKEEKEELEKIIVNDKVYSIRQHHLNLKIPKTWEYQGNVGLKCDTSLGFKGGKSIGFRWGTCFPFHPLGNVNGEMNGTGSGYLLPVLEIPLTIMDISVRPDTESWGKCQRVIDRVEEQGGVLNLLWHHTVFNDKEYPGWGDMYEKLIVECQRRGAWITNARNIADWWLKRNSELSDHFCFGSNSEKSGFYLKQKPGQPQHPNPNPNPNPNKNPDSKGRLRCRNRT